MSTGHPYGKGSGKWQLYMPVPRVKVKAKAKASHEPGSSSGSVHQRALDRRNDPSPTGHESSCSDDSCWAHGSNNLGYWMVLIGHLYVYQLVLAEIMDGPPNCIFTVVFLFKYCCLSLNTLHGFQVSNAFLLQVMSWTRMSRSGTWRGWWGRLLLAPPPLRRISWEWASAGKCWPGLLGLVPTMPK